LLLLREVSRKKETRDFPAGKRENVLEERTKKIVGDRTLAN